ncbi:alpha/beta hydrolase [Pseudomonas aeruginosa]|uniref:alpha/beta fold hydrolase n=1 Tax=Pseudomonas aeruginosa TaxID=287 RepID=UPI0009863F1A|nr:alpha/beta hydrolase [Pseudomonas aeruginosa]MCS9293429.1 alpha/beta hydrolase [Pseudomonas aeruginosa]MCT0552154.1 alpha/beta hydrolase [Pseudomonas aeruginosa]MCT0618974.1 alpha/beta hydrolase [Pseudomonas aeruginosa]MCT1261357.1 alpha/beta hydrolase [Pseudomonas aeruginosa]MCT1328635.1 alpha/beta hydrolase [Pseudomonas aeruginosa]
MSGELASFEVDGYQLVYQDLGEGTPVLLVHGSLCDYRYWQWQLRSLGEHHRLIVPSLRHYYPERWDGQGADFTSARHVADLLALVERLGEPVHLLGHSRGGNLALRLALAAPDALRSLSLADPGGDYAAEVYAHAGLPAPEEPLERNQFRRQALELIRGGEAELGLELFVDTVSGAGVWKRSSATFRRMTLDNAMTLVGQVADQPPALALSELRSIDLPSLILNGERSPLPFPATAEALAAALPRAELQRIQGASHGLNATRPAAFNRSVLEFLARVDGVAPDVETS